MMLLLETIEWLFFLCYFFPMEKSKKPAERWLVISSIVALLLFIGSAFFLDRLNADIQWTKIGQDKQGNQYSVDQRWTVKRLENTDNLNTLPRYPYALRVDYADDSRTVDGFMIKAVMEQGNVNCAHSTVQAHKWLFLSESQMPVRLDQKRDQHGLLQDLPLQTHLIDFVCALKK